MADCKLMPEERENARNNIADYSDPHVGRFNPDLAT
jgi:hypothetical protein